jgi:hypothetical protein
MKPIKVAFECDPTLYEKFRRIYSGHGDVSRFLRKVIQRVVQRVEAEGQTGLGKAVADITTDIVNEDKDRGRI